MPGPVPKDPAQRLRRNRETRVALPAAGNESWPPLPLPPSGDPWPDVVQAWYATWARSPQATQFTDTDWQRLHMLAPQVLDYWTTFDRAALAEIRMNETMLGATVADRKRLAWDVAADDAPRAPAAPAASRPRLRAVDPAAS
jgi:hypothetical protein